MLLKKKVPTKETAFKREFYVLYSLHLRYIISKTIHLHFIRPESTIHVFCMKETRTVKASLYVKYIYQ